MADYIFKDDKLYCGKCEEKLEAELVNGFQPTFACHSCEEITDFLAKPIVYAKSDQNKFVEVNILQ